jgi:hypothetical protein
MRRAAASVLLLKGRSCPRGRRNSHRVRAGAEQGEERHWERLHRAAFLDNPAMTTSPTQREMNHNPALPRAASIPCHRAAVRRAPPVLRERQSCRTALVETPHRGYPKPQRRVF